MTAVLFARADSVYKTIPGLDVYDAERDARTFSGRSPVIAHPPCRSWGRLRQWAKPAPGEKELAILAVEIVRRNGGVLEHPQASSLWKVARLPGPRDPLDQFGGYTIDVDQSWWGHRARKRTWLYICGIARSDLPTMPLTLGLPSHVVTNMAGIRKGHPQWRPELSKAEREATPVRFAEWLVKLAGRIEAERFSCV